MEKSTGYDLEIYLKGNDEPEPLPNVTSIINSGSRSIKIPNLLIDVNESYIISYIPMSEAGNDNNEKQFCVHGSSIKYMEFQKSRLSF